MHHRSKHLYQIVSSMSAAIIVFLHSTNTATPVAGDISGMTFDSSGNPYTVEQDLLIPEGKKAIIKEGCIFLFEPYTGLNVSGDLLVEGTKKHNVVFTSINDSDYNTAKPQQFPNPFDWNGILVTRESGTVSLKNFILHFSVYGIKSQITDILIDNGLFRQNGQYHFTIKDKIQYVQDNIAFCFNTDCTEEPTTAPDTSQQNSFPEEKKTTLVKKNIAIDKGYFMEKGIPATIAGTGVASGVVSLIFLSKWAGLQKEYRETSDPVKARKLNHDEELPSYIAIGTGVFSLTAITTGAVLYWWWNIHEKKPVAVTPVLLPDRTGASVTITMQRYLPCRIN